MAYEISKVASYVQIDKQRFDVKQGTERVGLVGLCESNEK
jgi:hypothetical protein